MLEDAAGPRDGEGNAVGPAERVVAIADELRAIAANGVFYHATEYDVDRYRRVQQLAARLLALVDTRSTVELERTFRGDLMVRTPLAAADAAVFDKEGRLMLVQRTDSALWCIPGGAADVGEPPAHVAEREAVEETGLVVRARRLIGIFDNRVKAQWESPVHMYHLVFQCELLGGEARRTSETLDFRWVTRDEAATLPLSRTHVRKVPLAFRMYDDPDAPPVFD